MATEDYFNKPRTADYFDNLLANDAPKLLRKYAVHPADSSSDYNVQTSDAGLNGFRKGLQVGTQIEAGAVPLNKIVGYAHLSRKTRTAALTTQMEGADCIFMEVRNNPTAHWIPIYYLPWCPAKILHLTIPQKNAAHGGPQPDIFFTAAINGCSIFIQGTAKQPTIFHAGGNPVASDSGRDSTKIWRQFVQFMKDPTLGSIQAEINKAHHVTEWHMDPSKPRSTQQALDYEDYLKTNYKTGTVTITSVSPWGCVYGLRDAHDDWHFYLQENATITVETITGTNTVVQPRRFRKDKVTTTNVIATQTYGRPMSVREIWPNGGGIVNMKPPIPLVKNWAKL